MEEQEDSSTEAFSIHMPPSSPSSSPSKDTCTERQEEYAVDDATTGPEDSAEITEAIRKIECTYREMKKSFTVFSHFAKSKDRLRVQIKRLQLDLGTEKDLSSKALDELAEARNAVERVKIEVSREKEFKIKAWNEEAAIRNELEQVQESHKAALERQKEDHAVEVRKLKKSHLTETKELKATIQAGEKFEECQRKEIEALKAAAEIEKKARVSAIKMANAPKELRQENQRLVVENKGLRKNTQAVRAETKGWFPQKRNVSTYSGWTKV